jgi:hypothetical protein
MTRSACLAAASALALAVLLNVHVAEAQNAADAGQSANRIFEGGAPLTSQSGSGGAGLSAPPSLAGVAVVQSIAAAGAATNDRQTEGEKSAKITLPEKASLPANPLPEQKGPAEINQGEPPTAAKRDSAQPSAQIRPEADLQGSSARQAPTTAEGAVQQASSVDASGKVSGESKSVTVTSSIGDARIAAELGQANVSLSPRRRLDPIFYGFSRSSVRQCD